MTTMVYKYGLCRPTGNAEGVERQMRLAHDFGCGVRWDQDANNCHNLLAEYRERPDGEEEAPAKRQAKWARLGRHNETARKEDGNGAESLGPAEMP